MCLIVENFNICEKTQLKKNKIRKWAFRRNFEHPIKIWNTQMNEKEQHTQLLKILLR